DGFHGRVEMTIDTQHFRALAREGQCSSPAIAHAFARTLSRTHDNGDLVFQTHDVFSLPFHHDSNDVAGREDQFSMKATWKRTSCRQTCMAPMRRCESAWVCNHLAMRGNRCRATAFVGGPALR